MTYPPHTTSPQSVPVRLNRLQKRFGRIEALRGVDLSIAQGEVVALLGPNGAGKSTTIDLALGLSRPTAGSATLFGMTPRAAIVAGHVGAMLQGSALLPDTTVRESVRLVASVHKHPLPIAEALERARCTEIARQRISKLSGGQMQRARFAVAIVSNPELLILDEPTAAMDVQARRTFWESMREFTDSGHTVVFATHYLEEADAYADRIVMLRAGQIVADGTPSEVKALVAGRRIRAILPGVTDATRSELRSWPGTSSVTRHADQFEITSQDSDTALRRLLTQYPNAHDIEVTAHSMDDVFLALAEGETPAVSSSVSATTPPQEPSSETPGGELR